MEETYAWVHSGKKQNKMKAQKQTNKKLQTHKQTNKTPNKPQVPKSW